MKFTVDCKTWRYGGDDGYNYDNGDTALLNNKGYMCCLGHCAISMGIEPADILDISTPNSTTQKGLKLPQRYLDIFAERACNTALSQKAMGINDGRYENLATRIEKLTELFKNHGHEIEFINQKKEGK